MTRDKILTALSLVVAFGLTLAQPIKAEEPLADGYAVQAAHVHGQASLFVVLENQQLLIEFETPALNLVGFEHAPHDAQQRDKVESIRQQLATVPQLLSFSGGQCQLVTVDIDMGMMQQQDEHGEIHKGKDHNKTHEDHQEDHANHSDIQSSYRFDCQQPAALRAIDVTLLNRFPAIEALDVQWIVDGRQGGQTLSPARLRIELQ